MTDFFAVDIAGDTRAVLRFDKFPAVLHDRLFATLTSLERRLEAAVLAAEPERSGELKSLTGGRVYDHGDRIAAVVGVRTQSQSKARKAAALEYGSRGVAVTQSAHKMRLDHVWLRARMGAPVDVGTYSRTPTLRAMNFLRGPIKSLQQSALSEMRAAIAFAAAESDA